MSIPSNIDVSPGFDPTGAQQISDAQLLQLIASASPFTDKGLIASTDDVLGNPQVPDALTNTKWQRYFWRRVSAASIGVYVWNPSAATDATYLKWQSINIAGIAPGSIVNSMIADNTITDSKIANVDWSKVLNKPNFMQYSDAATGDLLGSTWANATIANEAVTNAKIGIGAVTTTKIANDGVQTVNIKDQAVTTAKIADDGVTTLKILALNVTFAKLATAFIADATNTAAVSADLLLFGDVSDANATKRTTIGQALTTAISTITFTQDNIAFPAAGAVITPIAHGLGAVPTSVRWVIRCTSAELGFAVNDEVPLWACGDFGNNAEASLSPWANATNLGLTRASLATSLQVYKRSATVGNEANIDTSKWVIKVYATL